MSELRKLSCLLIMVLLSGCRHTVTYKFSIKSLVDMQSYCSDNAQESSGSKVVFYDENGHFHEAVGEFVVSEPRHGCKPHWGK